MKRILASALVLSLLSIGFVGCGEKKAEKKAASTASSTAPAGDKAAEKK